MAYFNVNCHLVYIMKIPKYERTFVLKKYAHNVTQYEDTKNVSPMMSSPYHTLQRKNILSSTGIC